MDSTINAICSAIESEATAVRQYTERITTAIQLESTERSADTFEKLRLDHVEHLQELCIELTRLLASLAPKRESEET